MARLGKDAARSRYHWSLGGNHDEYLDVCRRDWLADGRVKDSSTRYLLVVPPTGRGRR